MEHQYIDVAIDEVDQNSYRQQTEDSTLGFAYYIMVTTALTTVMNGFLLQDIAFHDGNIESDCREIVMAISYYSHYLLLDGSAQIIICFFVICVLSHFKKKDSKKEVSKQLLFQVIDTGLSLLSLLIIEIVLQYKQYCVSYGVGVFLMMYSFWVYLLFFFLVIAKFNQ